MRILSHLQLHFQLHRSAIGQNFRNSRAGFCCVVAHADDAVGSHGVGVRYHLIIIFLIPHNGKPSPAPRPILSRLGKGVPDIWLALGGRRKF